MFHRVELILAGNSTKVQTNPVFEANISPPVPNLDIKGRNPSNILRRCNKKKILVAKIAKTVGTIMITFVIMSPQ